MRPGPARSANRLLVAAVAAVLLAGCELPRFGAPESASKEGDRVLSLWQGFFVAAMVVGAIVVGLITYTLIRYRRRSDAVPTQKHENIPIEILYTVTPIVVVAMLFGFSVAAERKVTRTVDQPDVVVNVTGFQWGWQFAYPDLGVTIEGAGEISPPELVVPVGQTTRFVLRTTDVNHSFWVPAFLEKRDLIQGVDNEIDVTPNRAGEYVGRCAEYCGLDHWRMPFQVRVVTQEEFDQWVEEHQT